MTGAIIVAAGVGSCEKQAEPLQMLGELSTLQHLILTFKEANISPIVVVAEEKEVTAIQKHIMKMGVICIGNDGNSLDRLEFVKKGIRFLENICKRIFITPVNIPLFSSRTVMELMKSKELVISPSYRKKSGHPLLIDKQLYSSILQYKGENGIRGALSVMPIERSFLELEDEGILLDLLVEKEKVQQFYKSKYEGDHNRVLVSLRLAKENIFFGAGTAELLELISYEQSVRMASNLMGISYSKAWKMIKKMEEGSGYTMVRCQQGGKDGGKAELTEDAVLLLKKYRLFEKRLKEEAEKIYDEIFKGE